MVFSTIWSFVMSHLDVASLVVGTVALLFVAFQIRQGGKSARLGARAANLSSLLAIDSALNACRDQRNWVKEQRIKSGAVGEKMSGDKGNNVLLAPYLTAFERVGEAIRLGLISTDRAYSSYARHLRELLLNKRAQNVLLDKRGGWENLTNLIIDIHEWSVGQEAIRTGVKPLIIVRDGSGSLTRKVDEDLVDSLRERASVYMSQRAIASPRWYMRIMAPGRTRILNLRALDQHIAKVKETLKKSTTSSGKSGEIADTAPPARLDEYLRGLTTARRLIRTGKLPGAEEADHSRDNASSADADATNER